MPTTSVSETHQTDPFSSHAGISDHSDEERNPMVRHRKDCSGRSSRAAGHVDALFVGFDRGWHQQKHDYLASS